MKHDNQFLSQIRGVLVTEIDDKPYAEKLSATIQDCCKEYAENQAAPLEARIADLENLARYLAGAWHDADEWIMTNAASIDAIGQYPMMQGTAHRLRVAKIGDQSVRMELINSAVNGLLQDASNGEARERSID